MSQPGRTIRLRLSYDGAGFHGWQVQPGLPTVQAALVRAVAEVTGENVEVHGSGRTDAGVHALGQVAHLRLERSTIPAPNLARALNTRLPRSLRVLEASEAVPDFHSRRDAVSKLYRYRIYRGEVCPPFLRRYVTHHPYPLNEEAMRQAAPGFVGEHDFRSFAAAPDKRSPPLLSTVRTVLRSEVERHGDELVYEVEGKGFLHHMVRNLVGYLLEVGRGARRAEDIPAVLAARSRRAAGPTAAAAGLYLVRVDYDEEARHGDLANETDKE
ncbi:MAG TPA: tRNA pseudouridine(38-40) synthase TruA [Terriglobales bacterium]|nr:tRNA pseudouridine(38-40) synthase TruA [Terriglobales bacterium]